MVGRKKISRNDEYVYNEKKMKLFVDQTGFATFSNWCNARKEMRKLFFCVDERRQRKTISIWASEFG